MRPTTSSPAEDTSAPRLELWLTTGETEFAVRVHPRKTAKTTHQNPGIPNVRGASPNYSTHKELEKHDLCSRERTINSD